MTSDRPVATGDRHVMVVGMHRSGTSALANAVYELGVGLPEATELIGEGPTNEKGHWESRELSRFDETVLRHLGCTWSAPVVPPVGWERAQDPDFLALRARAVELAARCFSHPPVVLKDPRLCVTLPLWRSILPTEPCVVLIVRNPLDVSRSLQARDGFPLTLGLAIWERYVRQSIRSVADMPVYAVDYGAILDDPGAKMGELAEFLGSCGIEVPAGRVRGAVEVFEKDLRHHHSSDDASLPEHHRELLGILRASSGAHRCWTPPVLPEEPGWVGDVVWLTAAGQAVTAGLEAARHELKWIKRSRLFRTSRVFWRATGTGPLLSDPDERADDSNGRLSEDPTAGASGHGAGTP